MKAIERVIQYIEIKGFNNSSFEKLNGLSNGYIATQFKRNADLGEGILKKILDNCLDINPAWLLTGEGEMLKESTKPPEKKTIDEKDSYIIELQKEKIEHLKEKIQALIKENSRLKKVQESDPDMYKVAEPEPKLKR